MNTKTKEMAKKAMWVGICILVGLMLAMIAKAEADTTFGGKKNNLIIGGPLDNVIYCGDGADVAHGGAGNDRIHGGFGNDELYGDEGDDVLSGNKDDDILVGGPGNDMLYGGFGKDVYYYNRGDGIDRIYEKGSHVRHNKLDKLVLNDIALDEIYFYQAPADEKESCKWLIFTGGAIGLCKGQRNQGDVEVLRDMHGNTLALSDVEWSTEVPAEMRLGVTSNLAETLPIFADLDDEVDAEE